MRQKYFRFHPRRTHRRRHGSRYSGDRRVPGPFGLLAGRQGFGDQGERAVCADGDFFGIRTFGKLPEVLRRP